MRKKTQLFSEATLLGDENDLRKFSVRELVPEMILNDTREETLFMMLSAK